MSDGQLNADVGDYLRAASMNVPPPQIISDPLVTGATPIEQLLRVLGLAANLSDSVDNATGAEHYAQRDAMLTEAAEKFAAQDFEAAQQFNDVAAQDDVTPASASAPDQTAALTQQLPQMLSGLAGAIAGAIGGALQPLAQIPQQAAQGLQQAMQGGTGLLQHAAGEGTEPIADSELDPAALSDDLFLPDDLAGGSGVGGGLGSAPPDFGSAHSGFPGGTAPTSLLGPAPLPVASTAPSSAPRGPITPPIAGAPAPVGPGGIAGMPMFPPGSFASAGGEKDAKTETKRVSVPKVRNGAPVQGRLSAPPVAPVVKTSEATPVITRRIVAPHRNVGDQSGAPGTDL